MFEPARSSLLMPDGYRGGAKFSLGIEDLVVSPAGSTLQYARAVSDLDEAFVVLSAPEVPAVFLPSTFFSNGPLPKEISDFLISSNTPADKRYTVNPAQAPEYLSARICNDKFPKGFEVEQTRLFREVLDICEFLFRFAGTPSLGSVLFGNNKSGDISVGNKDRWYYERGVVARVAYVGSGNQFVEPDEACGEHVSPSVRNGAAIHTVRPGVIVLSKGPPPQEYPFTTAPVETRPPWGFVQRRQPVNGPSNVDPDNLLFLASA